MGLKVYARVPFSYEPGRHLDRGEIFELRDFRNDQKLLGLQYCVKLDHPTLGVDRSEHRRCGECGREFVNYNYLAQHRRKRDEFGKPLRCNDPDVRGMTRREFAQLAGLDDESKVSRDLFPSSREARERARIVGPLELVVGRSGRL